MAWVDEGRVVPLSRRATARAAPDRARGPIQIPWSDHWSARRSSPADRWLGTIQSRLPRRRRAARRLVGFALIARFARVARRHRRAPAPGYGVALVGRFFRLGCCARRQHRPRGRHLASERTDGWTGDQARAALVTSGTTRPTANITSNAVAEADQERDVDQQPQRATRAKPESLHAPRSATADGAADRRRASPCRGSGTAGAARRASRAR